MKSPPKRVSRSLEHTMLAPTKRPSSAQIREDIERTRDRLGDSVEALGAQLNPSAIKQRVKDSVREATIGRVETAAWNVTNKARRSGRQLVATTRANPIPASLLLAGIVGAFAWMLLRKKRRRSFIDRW